MCTPRCGNVTDKRDAGCPDGGSILVVEDDGVINRAIRSSLGRAGYRTVGARTCSEGLAHAVEQRPPLLILDLNLPDGSGWALLQQIRSHDGRKIPAIVISSDSVTRAQLRAAEVDRWIPKPFDMVLVVESVTELMPAGSLTRPPCSTWSGGAVPDLQGRQHPCVEES